MKPKKRRMITPDSVRRFVAAAQLAPLVGAGLMALALANIGFQSSVHAQERTSLPNSAGTTSWLAVHVLGFEDAKRNTKGKLTVESAALQFEAGKTMAQVSLPSIRDVYTDEDNRQVFGGKTGTFARTAVPYGGGRVLGLFQEKVDVLTLEYEDSNGAFHGAIFRLAPGQAVAVKRQLVAQGVHVSMPVEQPAK